MDELLTEEEVLCLLDGYRSVINTDAGLLKFAEAVQKTQIGKRWRRVFRKANHRCTAGRLAAIIYAIWVNLRSAHQKGGKERWTK